MQLPTITRDLHKNTNRILESRIEVHNNNKLVIENIFNENALLVKSLNIVTGNWEESNLDAHYRKATRFRKNNLKMNLVHL